MIVLSNYKPSKQALALRAFTILGSNAAPAVPQLALGVRQQPAPLSAPELDALIRIGPASFPAAVELAQSTSNVVKRAGVILIGSLAHDPDRSIPILLSMIEDPDLYLSTEALNALGQFPAVNLEPRLIRLLLDPDHAHAAAYALCNQGANVFPVLLDNLSSTNRIVLSASLGALSFAERLPTLARIPDRLANYQGMRSLFNSTARSISWFMYAGNDRAVFFDTLRSNFTATGSPRVEATIRDFQTARAPKVFNPFNSAQNRPATNRP